MDVNFARDPIRKKALFSFALKSSRSATDFALLLISTKQLSLYESGLEIRALKVSRRSEITRRVSWPQSRGLPARMLTVFHN